MYYITDYTNGHLYKCGDHALRACLASLFDCEQDGVQSAIDALCAKPMDPETYWAEAFLNVAIFHQD